MSQDIIRAVEAKYRKENPPQFRIGDTVSVSVRIKEGDKERIQPFVGVVIARRGAGLGEMFTVRRIVSNEGVERTFPLHSPTLAKVEVRRTGQVRRAKLYYLRERLGKARRLRERHGSSDESSAEGSTDSGKSAKPSNPPRELQPIEV